MSRSTFPDSDITDDLNPQFCHKVAAIQAPQRYNPLMLAAALFRAALPCRV
ncbi:hypothetical protein MspRI1_26590 [Marinobacter sp. RI1]